MFVEANGVSLFYEVSGEGEPLVLLHGNGEDHHVFDVLSEKLGDHFTLYALDSRNHGQSERTDDYSYDTMAEDVRCFIQELDLGPVFLVGFSDGAIVGLKLAMQLADPLRQVEQQSDPLRRVDHQQTDPLRQVEQQQADPLRRVDQQQSDPLRQVEQQQADPFRRVDHQQTDPPRTTVQPQGGLLRRMALLGVNLKPEDFTDESLRELKDAYRETNDPLLKLMLEQPQIELDEVADVGIPTLLVAAENDIFKPESFNALEETLPDAELLIMTDHDHSSYIIDQDILYPELKEFFLR